MPRREHRGGTRCSEGLHAARRAKGTLGQGTPGPAGALVKPRWALGAADEKRVTDGVQTAGCESARARRLPVVLAALNGLHDRRGGLCPSPPAQLGIHWQRGRHPAASRTRQPAPPVASVRAGSLSRPILDVPDTYSRPRRDGNELAFYAATRRQQVQYTRALTPSEGYQRNNR